MDKPLAYPVIRRAGSDLLTSGMLAATLSGAVLLWRGRRETGHPAAPVNAISHWLWPQKALQTDDASLRYTATGGVVHYASAMLWAALYEAIRRGRRRPSATNACTDAAAVTAAAALVDLKLVPPRLTPGFEHRLTPRGLGMVYAGFALGLALGGLLALEPLRKAAWGRIRNGE
jgi:hypothetical protein